MRDATKEDVRQLTRLLDAMEHVDAVTPIVYPQDEEQPVSLLFAVKETIKHTSKPIDGPGVNNPREAMFITEMLSVFKNAEYSPSICLKCSPISPLKLSEGDADALIYLVEQGYPVGALPCPIAGMTAPMSLLGAVTQTNAEVLAILTLARLINPDVPVTYGGRLVVPNLTDMNTLGGSPVCAIVDVCAVQMAHYYNLVSDIYGVGTNGIVPDVQIGYEKGIKGTLATLSGSIWQSGVGSVNDAIAVSYEQIVIDNEIIGNVYHALMGLKEDEENFGFDAINDVMEGGEGFLIHDTTIKYMRSPELFNTRKAIGSYKNWDKWSSFKDSGIISRAKEVVESKLKEHHVEPVGVDEAKQLDMIYKKACEELM
jgi:trimethylamine--corrinoid protein Co-methyltransferase